MKKVAIITNTAILATVFMALLSFSIWTYSSKAAKSDEPISVNKPANNNIDIAKPQQLEPKQDLKLVPYNGVIEHIFFHPLVAYPDKAFDGDYISKGFDDWFVTVDEFNKIVNELYKRDYILVNYKDAYENKTADGVESITKRELMIPEGKKPIVISIDDLNYYKYMIDNGTVHKLVLDSKGNVATMTKLSDGSDSIRYDNEIVTILDKFVQEHPDFSLNGAKGIIALTGYEGILGYRTQNLESPEFEKEKSQVSEVVRRLKETGWVFASHSYTHSNTRDVKYEKLVYDTDKWKKEVESIIGYTDLYIYPFGARVPEGSDKFQYLYNSGFRYFFGVGPRSWSKVGNDYVLMDRLHMDGIYFRDHLNKDSQFFVTRDVIDAKARGWKDVIPAEQAKTEKSATNNNTSLKEITPAESEKIPSLGNTQQ